MSRGACVKPVWNRAPDGGELGAHSGKVVGQPAENLEDTPTNVLLELVFPKPKGANALGGELPLHLAVSFSIAVDLRGPESLICLWNVAAPGAAVPETSVHENRQSSGLEIEVGLTGNVFRMANPACDPRPHECHP